MKPKFENPSYILFERTAGSRGPWCISRDEDYGPIHCSTLRQAQGMMRDLVKADKTPGNHVDYHIVAIKTLPA